MKERRYLLALVIALLMFSGCGGPKAKGLEYVCDVGAVIDTFSGVELGFPDEPMPGAGNLDDGFYMPWYDFFVDAEGNCYVADKLRVQKFDKAGNVQTVFWSMEEHRGGSSREIYRQRHKAELDKIGEAISGGGQAGEMDWNSALIEEQEISDCNPFGDDRVIVTSLPGNSLKSNESKFQLLDRQLNLLSEYPCRAAQGVGISAIVIDPFTPRVLYWYGAKKRSWQLLELDEHGAVVSEEWWPGDMGCPTAIPGGKLIANKWDPELMEEDTFDVNNPLNYAVLNEELNTEYPLLTPPPIGKAPFYFDIESVTDKGFLYTEYELDEQGEEIKLPALADFSMKPLARFELPEELAGYSFREVSLAGDWLLASLDCGMEFDAEGKPSLKGIPQRLCLFKVRW